MIISDTHKFVFLHIPKCAGTSVRRQIERSDSYEGKFYGRLPHPDLGVLDWAHIPLHYLKVHFPAEFDKVRRYDAFALVRDPKERFVSSILQRLRLFKGVYRSDLSKKLVLREGLAAAGWLSCREDFCDPEYIHFAKQSSFLCTDDHRIVQNVFSIDNIDSFAAHLELKYGLTVTPDRRLNTALVHRVRSLRALQAGLRGTYSWVLSAQLRTSIVKQLTKWGAYVRPTAFYDSALENSELCDFVESYYAKDMEIYRAATAMNGAPCSAQHSARRSANS